MLTRFATRIFVLRRLEGIESCLLANEREEKRKVDTKISPQREDPRDGFGSEQNVTLLIKPHFDSPSCGTRPRSYFVNSLIKGKKNKQTTRSESIILLLY